MILSYNFILNRYKNKTAFDFLLNQMLYSSKLYNQALTIKNEFYNNNINLSFPELDKLTRQLIPNNYYRKLKAKIAQNTIKQLDINFQSYFKALKQYRIDRSKFNGLPKPPSYARKFRTIDLDYQMFKIKDNDLCIGRNIKIKIDDRYKDKKFKSLKIKFLNSWHLQLSLAYEIKELNADLNHNHYLGIDLGIDNFMTCVSKDTTFIINGKPLKSLNQYYNKTISDLKSKRDLSKDKTFNHNKIQSLNLKRRNLLLNYLHHISKYLTNYCVTHKIGKIVCGYNEKWKESISLGKKLNQKFVSIPFYKLINLLIYKCKMIGIEFITIDEAYTSKCSSLDLEKIEHHNTYLGTRIFRGLFKSKSKILNADVNGAINILRKYLKDNDFIIKLIHSKHIFTPYKLNVFDKSCASHKIVDSGIARTL